MVIRRLRDKRGFTIAEVMIAFIILAIGFTSMLYLALFAVKANMSGERLGNARFIAEQQAENLRSLDYRHPFLIDDGDSLDLDDISTPDFQDSVSRNDIDYDIMWNIAENIPTDGIKTIRIFVLWSEKDQNKTFEFTTFKGLASR